ncbi:MAG: hypothetical protein LC118_08050 [Dehalococcoidia bacterium]|nr:hypothetical protein [Dehalococcoidia bacterium]
MSTYATPIPGVAQYGQAALAAKTAYQQALARLNQKRQGTLRQFGYTGDIDPETGVVKNVKTDAYNPYGQFQQNRRQHAQGLDAARWSAQERGLGTGGGLAAQMENDLRYGYGAQDAQMGQDLVGTLADYQDAQTGAAQQRDSALYQAELDAARLAIQNEDFNPADYSGLDYPDYGSQGDNPVDVAIKKVTSKKVGPRAGTPFVKLPAPKAKAPAKPAPAKKPILPGQAKTSLAVINNKKKGR